ncbi:hypothetical protein [Umezakia ovalisporum]|uniref:hypothetical protein n=1 Tax=Umezakia ovalisporum TaxID=75695 RepID=UPI0026D7AB16
MNRLTSDFFVGSQAAIPSLAISQRTDSAIHLPVGNFMYDSGLYFDRGSGRIGHGS